MPNSDKNSKNGNTKRFDAWIIAFVLAAAEGLFFLSYIYDNETSTDKDLAMLGLLVIVALSIALYNWTIFFWNFIRERSEINRAALKALGSGGIKLVFKDKGARLAFKGIKYLFKGRLAESEECLNKAYKITELRANQCFCVEWLIKLSREKGSEQDYLWYCQKAVELAPDNPDVQNRLGALYIENRNLSSAEQCFEQSVKYDPNNGYGYYSLARIYSLQGDNDKAIKTLEDLASFQPTAVTYGALSVFYARKREYEKCRDAYEKAVTYGYPAPEKLLGRINGMKKIRQEKINGEDTKNEPLNEQINEPVNEHTNEALSEAMNDTLNEAVDIEEDITES